MSLRWMAIFAAISLVFLACRADAQTPQPGQTFRDCSDCPEMVTIPAGSFAMGSSDADTERALKLVSAVAVRLAHEFTTYEHPEHSVTIARPFALGKYDVTRGEFAVFVRETGRATSVGHCVVWVNHKYPQPPGASWEYPGFTQTDRGPALCISWEDAEAYVAWLNSKVRDPGSIPTGNNGPYRLPSEAEWEYAARGGTHTAFWWGDAIGTGNSVCDGCGSQWDTQQAAPVGSFGPNPFGLYDMLGNVSQWMLDCWNGSYVGAPQDGSAWLTGDCSYRVIRGGNWSNEAWILRAADRSWSNAAGDLKNYIGFRVARTLP